MLAPAGAPKPVINKIRENEPAFRKKQFIDRALEPILNTPEEFTRFLVEDRATSGRVVKEAGLTPQWGRAPATPRAGRTSLSTQAGRGGARGVCGRGLA